MNKRTFLSVPFPKKHRKLKRRLEQEARERGLPEAAIVREKLQEAFDRTEGVPGIHGKAVAV